MKQSETKNTSNINSNFVCEYCNFRCSKKGDYNRHIITRKHKLMCNETQKTSKIIKSYTCSKCNVLFNSRTTLWRHKKTCSSIDIEVDPSIGGQPYNNTANSNSAIDKELIMTITPFLL